jgi:pimeloyl-ACP methyl ester carboxylesterase
MHPESKLLTHDVRLATGVTLRCTERPGEGAETVLLLHGFTDSAHSWDLVLPRLPAGWRLLAPDQRGHGDSERPADGYTVAQLVADANALLDAAGAGRATVVGHSMGSFVAQGLALAAPARVKRLVLVGGSPRGAMPGVRELLRDVAGLADPVPEDFVRAFQQSCLARPVPAPFFERTVAQSRKLPARAWRALCADFAGFDVRAELARIACPTLVVWGARDALFGREEQDALVAGLPAAALRVYEASGHAPNWEEPERFARDVADFAAGRM